MAIMNKIVGFSFFFFLGICRLGNWLDTGDSAGSIRINLVRHRRDKVASGCAKDPVDNAKENGNVNEDEEHHEEKRESRRVTLGEHLQKIATFWRNKRMEERKPNDTP